jgi:hypothetical protein
VPRAGRPRHPPGSPPLFPLVPGGGSLDRERREYFARHFDAVLIGGGDLLRFDPSEPGYDAPGRDDPPRPYDAFLDFLWGECEVQPAILWNAPGAPFRFEPSRRLLVQRLRARNESLEERLQSIENSVTWRLLGSYGRLRSVVDALMRPASDDGTREDGTAGSR